MKSFARDQNEPDPSHFQTPIPLCKILFTYSTILPGKSIDRSPLYLTVSMYKLWAQKASELALKSRHGGSWPFISLALSDKRSEQIIFRRKSQFQKMRRWSHQPPNFSLTTKLDLKDTWKGIKLNFEMKVSLAQLLDLGTLCLIGLVVMLY